MSRPVRSAVLTPPTPPDATEAARWRHTRLRRRMLYGEWKRDLVQRIQEQVGSQRRAAWGPPDLSVNPFRVTARELSTLYLSPPTLRHDLDGATSTGELYQAIGDSGLWSGMPRYQANVIGCREYAIRPHATPDGQIRYRSVPADLLVAVAQPGLPDAPGEIRELRLRDGRWCWDVLSILDPERPIYQVREARDSAPNGLGADLTTRYLGAPASGDAYPYRTSSGAPVLPYVLHHAERQGDRLWDPFEGMELVEGSLNLAMLHSFWMHVVKDASWPQRLVIGARPAGTGLVDENGEERRQEIVTDPATLLILEMLGDGNTAQWGQWEAGGDPEALLRAIDAYAARLVQDAGVSGTDLLRSSGDPRSGYAISLSNEGKRAAQKRFIPSFEFSDRWLVSLSAVMLNRETGSRLPEDGYSVAYASIPLSPEELRARREHVLALVDAGLMSQVDAYMELHDGITREQARRDLARIAVETRDLRALSAPPPTQPATP